VTGTGASGRTHVGQPVRGRWAFEPGADAPAGRPPVSDLFGVKGRKWLAGLELSLEERETVDGAMREIEFLDTEIAAVERLIARDALGSAQMRRLMSVPGVNVIVAAGFLAAIGDIGRFESPRKLRLPRPGSARAPVRARPREPRPHLKAGLGPGAPRARRGVLDGGPPARAAARVLRARPRAPRALRRRFATAPAG
jgi:transposase